MADLKKWEPFRELASVQRDMDDFFRRVFGSIAPTGLFRREFKAEWYPAIDVYMKGNQFIVRADLPGVEPKDLDVSVTGNLLTLRGERRSDLEEKKEGYMYHETSIGSFERVFTLPEGVDTSKVQASFKNGILELTMSAKAEALPKKVKIEIEGKEEKKAA